MTVFVGQEMVNFPAPQKLDPKPQNRAKTVVCYNFFVKTHAWDPVNTNEFKDYAFHGN